MNDKPLSVEALQRICEQDDLVRAIVEDREAQIRDSRIGRSLEALKDRGFAIVAAPGSPSDAAMEVLRHTCRDTSAEAEVIVLDGLTIPENREPPSYEHLSPLDIIQDFNKGLEKKRFSESLLQQSARALAQELRTARNKRKRRHRKERGK